jgi:pimeloyl-ACP methyl ester carboxylesterase
MLRRLVLALLLAAVLPAGALAADPPEGTAWTEAYFQTKDGVTLHADVLLPKDASGRRPVILTVSPYTNHAAQTGLDGADVTASGPSNRFYDFLEQGEVFQKGYAYVMVDLRGFGGSGGCNDWGGPGEQEDVRAAVEWAGTQSWSNGNVGLYGKSYDAWTGLMGIAQRPPHLKAVVAQEPVVDGYRYLYMNRVRFTNSVATPASFSATDATPGSLNDSPQYHLNGTAPNAPCYALNIGQQQQNDPGVDFWKARNLVDKVKGADIPLFMTQGFLESNTKPDAVYDLWNNVDGFKRAWFGQFDHVRGTDKLDDKTYAMGRDSFVDEAMRIYDRFLKNDTEAHVEQDPPIAVQTSDGSWRAEERWPPADVAMRKATLNAGSYTDDGNNNGTGSGAGSGVWTISGPLPAAAHYAGVPRITVDVAGATPQANLVAFVYAIGADNRALLLSRGAYLLNGAGKASFDLYGQDWKLPAGSRIGVLVSSSSAEWFTHVPTSSPVEIAGGTIELPFLTYERSATIPGGSNPRLEDVVNSWPFDVPEATITAAKGAFDLPPALTRRVATLKVRRLKGRRLRISGTAPAGTRLKVAVLRGKRVSARRRVTAKPRYRLAVKLKRAGRYRVRVSAAGLATVRSKRLRVR